MLSQVSESFTLCPGGAIRFDVSRCPQLTCTNDAGFVPGKLIISRRQTQQRCPLSDTKALVASGEVCAHLHTELSTSPLRRRCFSLQTFMLSDQGRRTTCSCLRNHILTKLFVHCMLLLTAAVQ